MQIPFIGGAYTERCPNINAQQSINCFPVIDNKEAKNIISLIGTPGLKYFTKSSSFGSGSDGDVTISTNTTLTRDMHYNTLVVNACVVLDTAGFNISCSTSLTNNGFITDTVSGGAGGVGGTGAGSSGGTGSDGTKSGAGRGGDGGAGAGTSDVGGTGGKGGGVVRIYAKVLTNNGVIYANGFDATAPTGNAQGANGGSGGTVELSYESKTDGTVTATGGNGSDSAYGGIDSNTSLLLAFNGANGSTTMTNSAPGGTYEVVGCTAYYGASLNSTYKKFGSASCYFSGNLARVYADSSSNWNFGTGAFTIDFWFYSLEYVNTTRFLFGRGVDNQNYWAFKNTGYNCFAFEAYAYGVQTINYVRNCFLNANTWYHIELSRSSNGALKLFIDGVLQTWDTASPTLNTFPSPSAALSIGALSGTTYASHYGYIDEFRVSTAIQRHSSNFTPPGGEYTESLDGSNGTTSWIYSPAFNPSSLVVRGGGVFNSYLYVAMGANILKIDSSGTVTYLGALNTSAGFVSMDYNGVDILIVDGTVNGKYVTAATDVFHSVTLPGAATSCTFMDGYFAITIKDTGKFYISGSYDVTTWDPTLYRIAQGSPDSLLRCFHVSQNLWLFGTDSIEVYYNSGAADVPFERIPGALIEEGLASISAVTLIKDQLYFLSAKREIVRNNGYQREKISTLHVDTAIQGYSTVSDAISYEYRADGHIFFVISFPTQDVTWVYDITTDYWHQWSSYKTAGVAIYGRHRGALGWLLGGKYIVADYTNGNFYELSMTTYTDDGELIKRTRRAQYLAKDRLNVAHHEIDLDFEVGVGASSEPSVNLRWSDDSTHTWSNYYSRHLGVTGEYTTRVRWLRLGKSRQRVYEVTMSENVKFNLCGAYENLEVFKA